MAKDIIIYPSGDTTNSNPFIRFSGGSDLNYIMEMTSDGYLDLSIEENIVTSGLTLYLDAGNYDSYSGGTTWYDLSGNNYDADIFGTSVWNNGKFDFGNIAQTTQYIRLPHAAAQSTGTDYTLEFWMQPVSSGTHYFNSMATSGNNNYYILQQNATTIQRYTGNGSISYSNNEIFQFCVVRDGSDTGLLYKNGVSATTSTNITVINGVDNGGWMLNQEQDTVGGSFDASQCYRGAFMVVKLYNRALSATEVLQNFNAIKHRFGL